MQNVAVKKPKKAVRGTLSVFLPLKQQACQKHKFVPPSAEKEQKLKEYVESQQM